MEVGRTQIVKRIVSGICLLSALFMAEAAGVAEQYRNSDPYLYMRSMEEAEDRYSRGKWYEAYRAYRKALEYREGDEKALKGTLLSTVEAAKEKGDPERIIKAYEKLFSCQDLFSEDTELADMYHECVDYCLMGDEPVKAVEFLEDGMEVFTGGETVRKMRERKADILAHTQVKSETLYMDVNRYPSVLEKMHYIEYDEEGKEILYIHCFPYGRKDWWEHNSYDEDGNLIYVEHWSVKEEEEQKTHEEYRTYDEEGRLLHQVNYYLPNGTVYQEMNYEYDEKGNEIYEKSSNYYLDGELESEDESIMLSDDLQKIREVEYDGREYKEYNYYILETEDEDGNQVMGYYDGDTYTAEDIQNRHAVPRYTYSYTYDEKGNLTAVYYWDEEYQDGFLEYERIFDDRGNVIREESRNPWWRKRTTAWHYNDRNLLVKKEVYDTYDDDGKIEYDDTEFYIYDETDTLRKMNGERVVREYDRLGNPTKEYERFWDWSSVEGELPKAVWIYGYHYDGAIVGN